jgi:predicted HAD superfamily Cof-like phosphohydrolase
MYQQVLEFTQATSGSKETFQNVLPTRPTKMSKVEVEFLVKMILSETTELLETVCEDMEECRQVMLKCMGVDNHDEIKPLETDDDVCAEQADALIDIMYYILNAASKKSMNLDHVFQEVHKANMAKRDPSTGQFIIRKEDGKIMKPAGWQPPNVKKALFSNDTFSLPEHSPRHDVTSPND